MSPITTSINNFNCIVVAVRDTQAVYWLLSRKFTPIDYRDLRSLRYLNKGSGCCQILLL
jgi:hypothetical protein